VINYRPSNVFFKYFYEREKNKIARQSFRFMEREKSLKDTPLFSSFSCYHNEYEKTTKVYSVTFSCIFERENERRLSSRFSLQNPKKVLVHVTNIKKRKNARIPSFGLLGQLSAKNHTHKTIRVLGF
jgi:hypothetical protein